LKARAANVDLLDDLLATLTDTRELSELFDQISAVVKKVIPHDAMALPVMLPDGVNARRYASVGLDLNRAPKIIPVPAVFLRVAAAAPVGESAVPYDPAARPGDFTRTIAEWGFRPPRGAAIRTAGRPPATPAFMATQPGVYTPAALQTARRIADRFALCLAR